jgi:hypothetical protein
MPVDYFVALRVLGFNNKGLFSVYVSFINRVKVFG